MTHGTPAALGSSNEFAKNRLGLARWLFDPQNPLTARVAVNRYWQSYFGRGIVATPEDFGTQGALPTHPELLDWLATEFVRTGWDVKAMQRLIVTSATYRQSSAGNRELHQRDPANRLLARGPRFRMPAETIRDQALAISGLLVEKIGGPSVKPYQPDGLWRELASASLKYQPATGGDLYRRSIYTFIRRTVPPPAMTTFDAPNRETCAVRRARTNTPLQALVLMNDPIYLEAARALAERIIANGDDQDRDRIRSIFRRVLARTPTDAEANCVRGLLVDFRQRFRDDEESAKQFVSIGASAVGDDVDLNELATWTIVSSLLLNLDETLTRE